MTVTATDKAGNAASDESDRYTVDLSLPTVTVTKQASGDGKGVTYDAIT